MAVYLSPGVFPSEIDLSALPSAIGPLRPAFIGTATKGPVGVATLLTNPQQAIDMFGEPSPSSYMMYGILSYMEEGNECYGMRVAVEAEDGQPAALAAIAIDTSGANAAGWGRIPLFTGIDYGRISLRAISAANPYTFQAASVTNLAYNDVVLSSTFGATAASIQTLGTYTGSIADSFVLIVTGAPNISDGAKVAGATYQIIRNSDGEVLASGTFVDPGATGTSSWIPLGNGLSVRVVVTAGELGVNDTFTFDVLPDNRTFSVSVNGGTAHNYVMPSTSYTSVSAFVTAFNALLSGESYLMVSYTRADGTIVPQLRTTVAGSRIQITGSAAWALEVGQQQYAWDIPTSYLIGTTDASIDITTQNNRVSMNVIDTATTLIEFNLPVGLGQTPASIANSIALAGTIAGVQYFTSFALTVPGGAVHVVIIPSTTHQLATLELLADYSHIKTLRFADALGIAYPYKRAYRGFSDNRLILPAAGQITPSNPLSCETNPLGAQCAADSAYFQNIVGWLVATSPGSWLTGYTASLSLFTGAVGDAAGRYVLTIKDANGIVQDSIQDVSFDATNARYIPNLLNPGSKFGGASGNKFVNWEDRPSFLDNDTTLASYTPRNPSQFNGVAFAGMADGIPTDPAFSSELDAAIIGNPATSTGMFAFQNPEAIDINLLCTPGFSSGAVIGTGLQLCESRGDVLYIIDPPFGLRPQQVVDWHNGMLLSDLSTAINSSYGALYWGWIKIFDQFSRQNIWVPPSGHIAAVFSRTSREAEQWSAPAGLRRGMLLTALDVEYSPSQGERDLLYGSGNAVNPIVNFPQDGITVWGQRTLQRESSALDRVSTRMLLINLKKNAIRLLRNFVFEPNDSILRRQVTATLDPFLADIQGRRGLQAYRIICDETNNTPERVDQNQLWVSIFVMPTTTAEFIVLNLVVLQTSASFSAQEVLAAGGIVSAATAVQ